MRAEVGFQSGKQHEGLPARFAGMRLERTVVRLGVFPQVLFLDEAQFAEGAGEEVVVAILAVAALLVEFRALFRVEQAAAVAALVLRVAGEAAVQLEVGGVVLGAGQEAATVAAREAAVAVQGVAPGVLHERLDAAEGHGADGAGRGAVVVLRDGLRVHDLRHHAVVILLSVMVAHSPVTTQRAVVTGRLSSFERVLRFDSVHLLARCQVSGLFTPGKY